MKVLMYSEHLKIVEKSGVGRAIHHQIKVLKENNVSYTVDKSEDYDIVHINTVFPSSFLMSKNAKKKGKKVIFHAHSTEEDFRNSFFGSNLVSPLFKKWLMICYDSADLIITPTSYSKKILESYHLKKPIVNISNGIDLEYFTKNEAFRDRFRKKYQFNDQDKIIISVGLFIDRKGILDFIKLAEAMPQYQFVWFGFTKTIYLSSKVKNALKTKLPNLHFPGYICREELRDAYSGSDLFLFLTHEETEGIVLLEALAMKLPILIRDIPIYEDEFVDYENIYKGRDMTEFQSKIKGILEEELPSLIEEGYEIVKERDIKKVGKQLINEYKKLVEQK